jgi:hypothetical protein
MALTVTEKRLAHLQRVLLHQEKLAAGSRSPERPSKESQLRIPLLCEVRLATEAAASKSRSRRSRTPAQSKLQL